MCVVLNYLIVYILYDHQSKRATFLCVQFFTCLVIQTFQLSLQMEQLACSVGRWPHLCSMSSVLYSIEQLYSLLLPGREPLPSFRTGRVTCVVHDAYLFFT